MTASELYGFGFALYGIGSLALVALRSVVEKRFEPMWLKDAFFVACGWPIVVVDYYARRLREIAKRWPEVQ